MTSRKVNNSERKNHIRSLKKQHLANKKENARLKKRFRTRKNIIAAAKYSTLFGSAFAVFFCILWLIFNFENWEQVYIIFFLGFFVGIVLTPEFKPDVFNQAWAFQTFSGIIAGTLFYFAFLDKSLFNILASLTIGGLAGMTASIWSKYA